MKSNQRIRFLAAAAIAIGAASFSYAEDRPAAAGSDRTNPSDTSRNDRQDRAGDNSNRSSNNNNANSPDTQAVAVVIVKTVDAALNGDVRQISQNFGQRDQRRFEDANKDQAQQQNSRLQQAAADLKRNYREKYNKDLSLADASKAFGSDFIRPAAAADTGDRARPAGSRIEGSGTGANNTTGSGAAGSSGASATPNIGDGTTGPRGSGSSGSDRTITANSGASGNGTPGSSDNTGIVGTPSRNNDTANSQSVSIPASHGLAEVRLNLVKEGSDWKINVPSTLTPDRLQDNLARELNRANDMKAQWPADANDAQRALAHHVFIAVMDQDSSRTNGADRGAGTDRNSNSSDRDRDRNTGSTGTGSGAGNSTTGGNSNSR
jgi:hypothetical protein